MYYSNGSTLFDGYYPSPAFPTIVEGFTIQSSTGLYLTAYQGYPILSGYSGNASQWDYMNDGRGIVIVNIGAKLCLARDQLVECPDNANYVSLTPASWDTSGGILYNVQSGEYLSFDNAVENSIPTLSTSLPATSITFSMELPESGLDAYNWAYGMCVSSETLMYTVPNETSVGVPVDMQTWRDCWNTCDASSGSYGYATQVAFYGWEQWQCLCLAGEQWGNWASLANYAVPDSDCWQPLNVYPRMTFEALYPIVTFDEDSTLFTPQNYTASLWFQSSATSFQSAMVQGDRSIMDHVVGVDIMLTWSDELPSAYMNNPGPLLRSRM